MKMRGPRGLAVPGEEQLRVMADAIMEGREWPITEELGVIAVLRAVIGDGDPDRLQGRLHVEVAHVAIEASEDQLTDHERWARAEWHRFAGERGVPSATRKAWTP